MIYETVKVPCRLRLRRDCAARAMRNFRVTRIDPFPTYCDSAAMALRCKDGVYLFIYLDDEKRAHLSKLSNKIQHK
jgi:hypothetical protein